MTRREDFDESEEQYLDDAEFDADYADDDFDFEPTKVQQLVELFSMFPIIPGVLTALLSSPEDWYLAAGMASAFPAREHYRQEASVMKEFMGWLQVGLTILWATKGEEAVMTPLAPAMQWWANASYKVTEPVFKILGAFYESGQWMAERPITLVMALALVSTLRLTIPKINDQLDTMTSREKAELTLKIIVVVLVTLSGLLGSALESIKKNSRRFVHGNPSTDETQEIS